MDTFLKPFVNKLEMFHEEGINLEGGQVVKVHCLVATVDSVTRPVL